MIPNHTARPYARPKHIPYRPTVEQFINRPTSGSTIVVTREPGSPITGAETYRYGLAALHPNVSPGLELKISGPFWADFVIEAANNYAKYPHYKIVDDYIIEHINTQIEKLRYESFRNTLKTIYKDALTYGFSISELDFCKRNSKGIQYVESIRPALPPLFDIYTDEGNNLSKLYYRWTGQMITGPLLEKFVIATYPMLMHGNNYGISRLISIWPDVELIQILEKAQTEGVTAIAIKNIIDHYIAENMSDDDYEDSIQALYNLNSGGLLSFPATQDAEGKMVKSHEIEVMEDRSSAAGLRLIEVILEKLYKRVNRNLGLPDDLGFTTTKLGSWAKSKEETNLYLQGIIDSQEWVEGIVNRLIIPKFIKYNFYGHFCDEYYIPPKFRFHVVEDKQFKEVAPILLEYYKNGILTKDQVLKQLGITSEIADVSTPIEIGENPIPNKKSENKNFFKRFLGSKK